MSVAQTLTHTRIHTSAYTYIRVHAHTHNLTYTHTDAHTTSIHAKISYDLTMARGPYPIFFSKKAMDREMEMGDRVPAKPSSD